MLSDKLKKLLESHPKIATQLDQIADRFSERAVRLGQGEPIITKETMHLMAVEMQLVLRAHGLDARIIVEKTGGGGARITLTSPEESKKIFVPKKKEDETS